MSIYFSSSSTSKYIDEKYFQTCRELVDAFENDQKEIMHLIARCNNNNETTMTIVKREEEEEEINNRLARGKFLEKKLTYSLYEAKKTWRKEIAAAAAAAAAANSTTTTYDPFINELLPPKILV